LPADDNPNWGSMSGIGLQVAVGVGLGVLIGLWLDRKFDWSPWGMLIGLALGLAGGLYSMFREVNRINRDPPS